MRLRTDDPKRDVAPTCVVVLKYWRAKCYPADN